MALKSSAVEAPLLHRPDDLMAAMGGTFFDGGAAFVPYTTTITHRWRDIKIYRNTITHSWAVLNGAQPVRITHTWRVRNVRNRKITHRWRVLEPGTTGAYSDDIQLPYSEREIETED